jgi:8-oxo-dGTP pyrophosphatase MutT (NUDIX family)
MTGDPGPIGNAALGAACAIFDDAGRVLLVRHTYGKLNWEIPGGVCMPGEDPVRGAERELHEETGLSLRAGSLSGVYFEPGHDLGAFLHFVFRFGADGRQQPVAQPPEISDVGWFALDALPVPISDLTELRIRDALGVTGAFRVVAPRVWRE